MYFTLELQSLVLDLCLQCGMISYSHFIQPVPRIIILSNNREGHPKTTVNNRSRNKPVKNANYCIVEWDISFDQNLGTNFSLHVTPLTSTMTMQMIVYQFVE
jgi:hypothetical protein